MGVEFVGGCDQYCFEVWAPEHLLEAGERFVNLKFGSDLSRPVGGGIRHGNKASFRNQAANIFRMALAHLSDSKNANSQLRRHETLQISYRFDKRLTSVNRLCD